MGSMEETQHPQVYRKSAVHWFLGLGNRVLRWGESLWFPTIHEEARPEGAERGFRASQSGRSGTVDPDLSRTHFRGGVPCSLQSELQESGGGGGR